MSDRDIDNDLYRIVGEELLARKERSVGAAAKAAANAQGNRDLAESLYINYRVEELKRELESELKRQTDDKARQEAKDAERLLQARKAAAKEKKKTACPKCGHLDDEMNFLACGWGGVLPALAVPVSLFVFFWLDDFFPDTVGLITTKWGSIGLWVVKGSVFVAICSGLFWPLSVVRAKCSACGARFKGGDIIKPT